MGCRCRAAEARGRSTQQRHHLGNCPESPGDMEALEDKDLWEEVGVRTPKPQAVSAQHVDFSCNGLCGSSLGPPRHPDTVCLLISCLEEVGPSAALNPSLVAL